MNIIINQKKFLAAIRIVERVISKSISLPILNMVYLKTDNGRLKLMATNLEIGINYWISAKINEDGEILIPTKIFSDFVSNISDEKIILTADKNKISVNSENYKTQILGMDTKDFPSMPKIKKEPTFKINAQELKNSLLSVFESAATSETRPELSGVFVNLKENMVEFAATDSFRLSEKITKISNDKQCSIIIPRNTALEIIRISEGLDEEIGVSISDNQLLVFGANFELVSRLIDGRYPEYKKIIPEKFLSSAKINKLEFEKNIRLASVFSSSIADINLKIENNKIEIAAKNSEKGEIKSSLPCELKNKPFSININYHYLLDGLKTIPVEDVVLEYTGDGSPLVIKGDGKKDQVYIIMPLRN